MTTALGCIYVLGMGFFAIAFLFEWINSWQAIRKYVKYGILAGLIVVGPQLLIVAMTPSSWQLTDFIELVTVPIVFFKQLGFTMLGMYYLAVLGYPSFPVFLQKFSPASDESNTEENIIDNKVNTCAETTDNIQPANSILHEMPEQIHVSNKSHPALDLLLDIKWKDYFLTIFWVSIIGILYSVVLFLLTTPQLSEMWQKEVVPSSAGVENATIQVILTVLTFAVAEEIIFRLGIQSFLVKYLKLEGQSYWIAIVITSGLWTLGHVGTLDPAWVKTAQIFPVGLMLGWLFRKYGAESTILAHGLFNVVLVFLPACLFR
jgi:membrane protease YdiL (CAAX protease family)